MTIKRSFFKFDRRIAFAAGLREKVQTITLSGAAPAQVPASQADINPYGVTVINSTGTGGPWRVNIPLPPASGIHKTIIVNNRTTADVVVVNKSTATKFYGSTVNSVLWSTVAAARGQGNLELISVSTAAWALLSHRGSTAATHYPVIFQNSSN